jgi:hypothetical protein
LVLESHNPAQAQRLYERALAIHERVDGPEHPDVATILTNLGKLLYNLGESSAARPLLERALAIRQKVLGPEHPDTVRSRENLADGWEWDAKENWRNVPAPNYKGKYLQLEFTVEDAGVFTTPWTATMTYGRGAGNWPETVIQ